MLSFHTKKEAAKAASDLYAPIHTVDDIQSAAGVPPDTDGTGIVHMDYRSFCTNRRSLDIIHFQKLHPASCRVLFTELFYCISVWIQFFPNFRSCGSLSSKYRCGAKGMSPLDTASLQALFAWSIFFLSSVSGSSPTGRYGEQINTYFISYFLLNK